MPELRPAGRAPPGLLREASPLRGWAAAGRRWLVAFALPWALLTGCASQYPAPAPQPMTLGAAAVAPVGYRKMCADTPDLCDTLAHGLSQAGVAGPPDDYEQQMALLNQINRQINGLAHQTTALEPETGEGAWARMRTTSVGLAGDCDQIAVEKRITLLRAGYDADALRFGMVYRRDIGLHIVLIARTDRGEIVLDSRTPWLSPWNDIPYTWVEAQSVDDPNVWRRVGTPQAPAAPDDLRLALGWIGRRGSP